MYNKVQSNPYIIITLHLNQVKGVIFGLSCRWAHKSVFLRLLQSTRRSTMIFKWYLSYEAFGKLSPDLFATTRNKQETFQTRFSCPQQTSAEKIGSRCQKSFSRTAGNCGLMRCCYFSKTNFPVLTELLLLKARAVQLYLNIKHTLTS